MRSFGFVVGFTLAILLLIVLAIRIGIGPYAALFGAVRSPLGLATVMFYCIAGVIALRVSSNRLESVGPESRIWLYGLTAFSEYFAWACSFMPQAMHFSATTMCCSFAQQRTVVR